MSPTPEATQAPPQVQRTKADHLCLDPFAGLTSASSDFDGNTTAMEAKSFWSSTGWFENSGTQVEATRDDKVLAAVGGARTQNRFATAARITRTCAEGEVRRVKPLEPRPNAPAWTFDFEKWRWHRVDETIDSDSTETDCDADNTSVVESEGCLGKAAAVEWHPAESTIGSKRRRQEKKSERTRGVDTDDDDDEESRIVAGYASQFSAITEAISTGTRCQKVLAAVGVRPVSGVLISGPSGVGKTHIALAAAAKLKLHVEHICGAECMAAEAGAAEDALSRRFSSAVSNAPSVVVIDEIDALAPDRASAGSLASAPQLRLSSALLSQLDKLSAGTAAVSVIATTSRASAVDPSARRAGRLEKEVAIPMPSDEDRRAVLELCTQNMPLADDVLLEELTCVTRGRSPADLRALCTEAALCCLRRDAPIVLSHSYSYLDGNNGSACEGGDGGYSCPLSDEEVEGLLARARVTSEDFASAAATLQLSALVSTPGSGDTSSNATWRRNSKWEDVGGLGEVKSQLRDLIELPIKYPTKFATYGVRPPRGLLMYGPPGCGKTMLARCTASQCGANFIEASAATMLSKWAGESEKAIRDLFAAARAAKPCVLFIDEIDAIACRRGGAGTNASSSQGGVGDSLSARVLNQVLCEMDGVSNTSADGVFLIGATNRPLLLDEAITRPGRLDVLVHVHLPDKIGRKEALNAHLSRAPMTEEAWSVASAIATEFEGASGADMADLARRACLMALKEEVNESQTSSCVEKRVLSRHIREAAASVRLSVPHSHAQMYVDIENALKEGKAATDVLRERALKEEQDAAARAAAENATKNDVTAAAAADGQEDAMDTSEEYSPQALVNRIISSVNRRSSQEEHAALLARCRQLEESLRAAGVDVPPFLA